MKTFINLTTYFLFLLGLCSCNGDVFVDDFRAPDSELTLNGNGDVATIHFASSNWDLLEVYVYENGFSYPFKVYDADGNLTTEEQHPYLKGLGKIVCDEQLTDFIIERSIPEEVKITVGENVRSTQFRLILIARNEYESQEIYVDISPSDRYVFDRITYSLDMYSYDEKIEVKKSIVQSNYTDNPYLYLLFPYKDVYHEVTFESNMSEAFQLLGKDNLIVEIPTMISKALGMNGVQAQYISTPQALPFPFPDTEKVEVPIQPYTTQRITLLLGYEWFETEYTLYAFHPKSKKRRIITGMLRSKMPESYYIKRDDIK